jgi:hypothetical protein
MKKDQLEKIKQLVALFEARDQLYQQSTEKIFESIGETTLEALVTLFGVPYENVSWLETQLIDTVIVIVASISYGEDQLVPPVIQALSPAAEHGHPSIRLFRIGLPLDVVFLPKEEIVDYLVKTAEAVTNKMKARQAPKGEGNVPVKVVSPQPEFDTSGLSREQVLQVLLFGEETRGTKH